MKDISETNPSAGQYVLEWLAFAFVSLLPLFVALVMLALAREPTERALTGMRGGLEHHARTVAAGILLLLAAALMRNGIAGLTG